MTRKTKASPNPTKRSARSVVEAREDACFSLLLQGTHKQEIIAYAIRQGWGVTRAQVYKYIEKAHARIKNSKAIDRDFELGREMLRRDALYRQSIQQEDVRAALAVCDSRCELLGLFAPTKRESQGDIILEWEDAPDRSQEETPTH